MFTFSISPNILNAIQVVHNTTYKHKRKANIFKWHPFTHQKHFLACSICLWQNLLWQKVWDSKFLQTNTQQYTSKTPFHFVSVQLVNCMNVSRQTSLLYINSVKKFHNTSVFSTFYTKGHVHKWGKVKEFQGG